MGRKITRLKKPLTRVVAGDLVATITETGIELRGIRKRVRRKSISWEQIAALEGDPGTLTAEIEKATGRLEFAALGITPPPAEKRPLDAPGG